MLKREDSITLKLASLRTNENKIAFLKTQPLTPVNKLLIQKLQQEG